MSLAATPVRDAGAPAHRQRDELDAVWRLCGAQLRHQRDAQPRGDEREDRGEVVGVVAHPGRIPGPPAQPLRDPVPLVVYHVPHRTGQPLSAPTVRRLAAITGVAGVKYAVDGIDAQTIALLADVPPGFAVLGGDDVFVSPLLAEPNPTVIKSVLHAQGRIPTAAVRPPLLPARAERTREALWHLAGLEPRADGPDLARVPAAIGPASRLGGGS